MAGDINTVQLVASRSLSTRPPFRPLDSLRDICELLQQQAFFSGLDLEQLIPLAYFIEYKHAEAGECVLSKGQPLEHWCLVLEGGVTVHRYSTKPGSEQQSGTLGPGDSWGEAALLHSSALRRSSITVVAGPQGCATLQLRYTDYDALCDPRSTMPLAQPEGAPPGPLAGPTEIALAQRRAAAHALLCCTIRRLTLSRPPAARTPEEVLELEPFLLGLAPYRAYPAELVSSMAAHARTIYLPPGSIVYEVGTLADAHITVLSGEVQMRRFVPPSGAGACGAVGPEDLAAESSASSSSVAGQPAGGPVAPAPPGLRPAAPPPPGEADAGGRMSIRARLKREREARKMLQRQLDDYVAKMDQAQPDSEAGRAAAAAVAAKMGGTGGPNSVEWTKMFMQKAMQSSEPLWKALHPDDTGRGRAGGDGVEGVSLDDEAPTEVAQLLGPAAAKAYQQGLRRQGYGEPEPAVGAAGAPAPGDAAGGAARGGRRPTAEQASTSPRQKGQASTRWSFSVEGPETQQQRQLRDMAIRASRIQRDQQARSRHNLLGSWDIEEAEEAYGPLVATLAPGSPVGELSTVMLHSTMRQESAIAGQSGCELMLVDWEAYQAGVLAARSALLARAAPFLRDLSLQRRSQLAELCLCLCVESGTLLARQGGALDAMAVVQDGELQLLHEVSASSRTPTTAVTAHAVSRVRHGRMQTLPLLATLSQTLLPTAGATPSGPSPPGAVPSPPGPSPSPPAPAGQAPGGGAGTSGVADVTLHGLPLAELGPTGIIGEAVLGVRGPRGAGATASGVEPGSPAGGGSGGAADANGTSCEAEDSPASSVGGAAPHPLPPGAPPGAAAGADGPKWPATVVASRPTVLLVIQKSTLYMAEFDFIRGELKRCAAERQAWMAKRLEAAYRDASAPPSAPAVFTVAAATAAFARGASPAPQPPLGPPSSPSLGRSMFTAGGLDASDAGVRQSATDAPGPLAPSPPEGPPPEGILPRSGSLSAVPSVPYMRSGSAQRERPSASKWDFLDSTPILGSGLADAPADCRGVSIASSSFGRGPAPPASPGGSGPPGMSRAGSLTRSVPMRRPSPSSLRRDVGAPPLTPVQQSLLEAGLDVALADMAPGSDGSRRAPPPLLPSSALPVLAATSSPRVGSMRRGSYAGEGDPLRASTGSAGAASGQPSPYRSPGAGALTSAGRRSFSGNPTGALPPSVAASLLDQSGSASFSARTASPSTAHYRSSCSGLPGALGRGSAADLPTLGKPLGKSVCPASPGIGTGTATASPQGYVPHGVPGLGVADALAEAGASPGLSPVPAPAAGGFYARTSFSGSGRFSDAGVRSSLGSFGHGAGGAGGAAGAGGEEAAMARALVPQNQAGKFMVREGAASTPAKQPGARRIAHCF